MTKFNRSGFTIIEVMIATLIFTLVLLLIIYGVTSTTNDYFRGVNSSTAQTTARSVLDSVTQAIQFSTGNVSVHPTSGPATTYCVGGTKQFDFNMFKEVGVSGNTDAIWETPMNGASCGSVAPSSNSQSLIGNKMRLQRFNITQIAPNTYNVEVEVIYGDSDLLCDDSSGSSPNCPTQASAAELGSSTDNLICRHTFGSQFCYVSDLSTTVQTRGAPLP